MTQFWIAIVYALSSSSNSGSNSAPAPFTVQFAHSLVGRMVTISIDGKVEQTFAGKMGFREANRSWQSLCADVRSPVHEGQFYMVAALSTAKVGGNYAKAGNIVARYFRFAQTPEQCAGLQIAVWKVIEDGSEQPNFLAGHFQVHADPSVMLYAIQYYQAQSTPGDAALLAAGGGGGGGGGQSQISPNDN